MSFYTLLRALVAFLLLSGVAVAAHAQSVCVGPYLGDGGVEELCVHVNETGVGGVSMDFRGPSPLVIPPTAVGDYTVAMMAIYASDADGMAVILDGTVTRTSAGTDALVIVADGGLGTPITLPSSGSLVLVGAATDVSQTVLGGAAGFAFGPDTSWTSLGNIVCDEVTFGAGAFGCAIGELPVDPGTVAARNITTFHLNNVGQTIDIPSGAVVGDPPLIGEETELLELEVNGVLENFTSDQFTIYGPEANCAGDHWHTISGSATSLEGSTFTDNPECGAGKKSEVTVREFGEVDEDTEMPIDQNIDDGEGMIVASMLEVPGVLTLTNRDGGTLAVTATGTLHVDGTVINEAGGNLQNHGTVVNTSNTIRNRGLFVNRGTIDNTGTITNECGGVFENLGTLVGNPVIDVGCPDKAQQACANALNKSMAGVARAQDQTVGRCIRAFARNGASADACLGAVAPKVARARAKTDSAQAKKCTGTPMGFGPADSGIVNDAASAAGLGVISAVFGSPLDAALVTVAADPTGARCQSSLAKEGGKCLATRIKEFNRCKKKGLKGGTVVEGADLAACLGSDPKGKIARACDETTGKLATKILPKACGTVDLARSFPGCAVTTQNELATCVETSARCEACTALTNADGFSQDCDLFDDGVTNASCR